MRNPFCHGMVVLSLSTLLWGCATRTTEVMDTGDENCRKRVLIAAQQSEFKDAVVSNVVEALGGDACYLKIIDVKKLGEESTEDYEAIVIVNTCWARRLNRHVRKFLKDVQAEGKVVLLTTAGNEGWKLKGVKVDAITSASKMDKAGTIADAIVGEVRIRLVGNRMISYGASDRDASIAQDLDYS